MIIKLTVDGRETDFKVDTGFAGECVLSYELFKGLESEELDGPIVSLINGYGVKTSMKLVTVKYGERQSVMACISSPSFGRNLLGEKALASLGVRVDYKRMVVEDP